MDDRTTERPVARAAATEKHSVSRLKSFWRKVRGPLRQSRVAKAALTSLFWYGLRFIRFTNPPVDGSAKPTGGNAEYEPCISALWHGQHLLAPAVYPSSRSLVAMVSRSADAELNAKVIEKFGIEAVRGSGGRDDRAHLDKGGARALIALKKSLAAGKNVVMIADIPHGTPRQAGMGVICSPACPAARSSPPQSPPAAEGCSKTAGTRRPSISRLAAAPSSLPRPSTLPAMPTMPRWNASARN